MLTVDLTNRCNMMCNPCFMDANQVGYVHELTLDDIQRVLDDSISFKPRRQMVVQFSGGEPTLSPHFLDACAYAKKVGYTLVQAATNGLRFALEPEFAFQAKEAGFDMVYLQFDGITNEANSHRHISNLFDVKQVAIDNLHAAGHQDHARGHRRERRQQPQGRPDRRLLHEEPRQDGRPGLPARVLHRAATRTSATRRRIRQRYTTSHLAHDLSRYYDGRIDPLRDWYPARLRHALSPPSPTT